MADTDTDTDTDTPQAGSTCAKCAAELRANAKFCPKCGYKSASKKDKGRGAGDGAWKSGRRVKAVTRVDGQAKGELSFKRGAVLQILSLQDGGLIYGMDMKTWTKGTFPRSAVKLLLTQKS